MNYELMIVEDERVEREALTLMLKLHYPDVKITAAVDNGGEAFSAFQKRPPDIVLMDINLPGLSGLEVIRSMRRVSDKAEYVILSAHNTFEYAQAALKLGVCEYLLKPYKLSALMGVMDSCLTSIQKKRTMDQFSEQMRRKIDSIRPVLESDCIFAIAAMRTAKPLKEIFDFMEITANEGFVFIVKADIPQRRLIQLVKGLMEQIGLSCIGDVVNGMCVFVALSRAAFSFEQVEGVVSCLSNALGEHSARCQIGVGSPSGVADGLRKSYEQALRQLSGEPRRARAQSAEAMPEPNVKRAVQRIVTQIDLSDAEGIRHEVQDVFANLTMSGCPREQIYEFVYRLYVMTVSQSAGDSFSSALDWLPREDIERYEDLMALCERMVQCFLSIIDQKGAGADKPVKRVASAAIDYLNENFRQNLSLNQLSEQLHISPFYLTRLVKRQTGQTFNDYLTYLRIELAKELLTGKAMSIKEITFYVGFNSQNYFSKVFKKHTGFAPSEYRGQ